jgi:hypothetical protein
MHSEAERDSVIAKYRVWFDQHKTDPEVRRELAKINQDTVLGCWCAPKACHADVIMDYMMVTKPTFLKREELFRWKPNTCFIVTTNGKTRSDGALIMGRGAALQLTQKVPNFNMRAGEFLAFMAGKNVNNMPEHDIEKFWQYGSVPIFSKMFGNVPVTKIDDWFQYHTFIFDIPTYYKAGIGLFQVKKHWNDKAELGIIAKSAQVLADMAKTYPDTNFRMNMPGVGNGGLEFSKVLKLIAGYFSVIGNLTVCYK